MKMKKIGLLLLAVVVMTLMTGCEIYGFDNGALDGFWQLTEMTVWEDGVQKGPTDMRESGIYWGVQGDLLRIDGTYFDFEYSGHTLRVWNPYSGDTYVEDASELKRYGLYNLEEIFIVEQLRGSEMTQKTELVKLCFRKY